VNRLPDILRTPQGRIAALALTGIALDQATKQIVLRSLEFQGEGKVVIPGFFRFVHWGNTGAAWSLFTGNNGILIVIALLALGILYVARHHFDAHSALGQVAFGLIFGGIIGNLIDRLFIGHVVDFLYFYVERRGGGEAGFPAFNVADSMICIGVGLVFYNTWRSERLRGEAEKTPSQG
jgi:signal peptidase II